MPDTLSLGLEMTPSSMQPRRPWLGSVVATHIFFILATTSVGAEPARLDIAIEVRTSADKSTIAGLDIHQKLSSELGFAPKVLTEHPRIVHGLIAGSAAERAGLRNGDEITVAVGQDKLQGEQDGVLTLSVKREGKNLTIKYQPRGATVPAWQWEPVGEVAGRTCALPGR